MLQHLYIWEHTLNGVGTILHKCVIRPSQNMIDARTPPSQACLQHTNTLSLSCQMTAVSWEAHDDWKTNLMGGFFHTLYIAHTTTPFAGSFPTQTQTHTQAPQRPVP